MKLNGKDPRNMKKMMKGAGPSYVLMFISVIISAIVLQLFITALNISSAWSGAGLGLAIWVGFVATSNFGMALFNKKPAKLYVIENLHLLIGLMVMGAILVIV